MAHYIGAKRDLYTVPNTSIQWAGGRTNPPPDTPECGFDGSLCESKFIPKIHLIRSEVILGIVRFSSSGVRYPQYRSQHGGCDHGGHLGFHLSVSARKNIRVVQSNI